MPKRATEDAPHVTMTDHRISLTAPKAQPPGELAPFRGTGRLDLARLRHTIDSGRGTEADYRRWAALEPRSVPALASLGEALMRFGKPAEALPVLQRARKADPGNVVVLNALAVYEATRGRLPAAMRLLETARAADPDHPLTWINIGVTREALGDRTGAEAAYREAIRHQPDSSGARRRLGALIQ